MISKSMLPFYLAILVTFVPFQLARGQSAPGLKSNHFTELRATGDPRLEAALISDPAHILQGAVGDHVAKIQVALKLLDNLTIDPAELAAKRYGPSTAAAVLAFKQRRHILGPHQTHEDNIVGKRTMAALDQEMKDREARERPAPPPPVDPAEQRRRVIDVAFTRSRNTVQATAQLLQRLEADIEAADRASGNDQILAIANIGRNHSRNIAVISRRLNVGLNPLSPEFRSALRQARERMQANSITSGRFIEQGETGRCTPGPGAVTPFAATTQSDPEPRVSICSPFFTSSEDLQRDVITHEFFHLNGVADIKRAATTTNLLNNANTLAQIVAFLSDRSRQVNSDGEEPAIPPLPAP